MSDLIRYPIIRKITIPAGQTDTITIDLSLEGTYFLDSFGYNWFSDSSWLLQDAKGIILKTTSQIGSLQFPFSFENLPIRGGWIKLTITNSSTIPHDYIVSFIIKSDRVLFDVPQDAVPTELDFDATINASKTTNVDIYTKYKSYEQTLYLNPVGTITTSAATTGGTLDESGATYYYKVEAYFGEDDPYNIQNGITVSSEVSQATGTSTSTNKITLSWIAVTGATSYKVYRNRYLRIPTASAVISPGGSLPTSAQYYRVAISEVSPAYTSVASAEVTATPSSSNLSIRLLCIGKLFVDASATTGWTAVGAGSGIATTTTIGERWEGAQALKFNKTNTAVTAGYYNTSLTSVNATDWNNGNSKFGIFVYLPSLTDLVKVTITIGSDLSNCIYWDYPVANLVVGWNFLSGFCNAPTGTIGNPVWTAFDTAQILLTTGSATTTYTGIIFDAGFFFKAGNNIQYKFYGRGTGTETLLSTQTVPYYTDDGSLSPGTESFVSSYSGKEKFLANRTANQTTYVDDGSINPSANGNSPISSTQELQQLYDIQTGLGELAYQMCARCDASCSIKINSQNSDSISLGGSSIIVDSVTLSNHAISKVYFYSGTANPATFNFRLLVQGL